MERLTEEKDECPLVDDLQILKLPQKKEEAKQLVTKLTNLMLSLMALDTDCINNYKIGL